MLEQLKIDVCAANLMLPKLGLVKFTWGNVSAIDRKTGLVVIKPSGVDYQSMKPSDMVVVNLNGEVVEGKYRPSSDTATHIELYKKFPEIGGIVHTHSCFATVFAQARTAIPALGTTHADCFYGDIPCTRPLTEQEVHGEYEKNTGLVIACELAGRDVMSVPGVLAAEHGPFAWGADAAAAVMNAAYLEESARLAYYTLTLKSNAVRADQFLLDKHYTRKHGKNAYYGQGENK